MKRLLTSRTEPANPENDEDVTTTLALTWRLATRTWQYDEDEDTLSASSPPHELRWKRDNDDASCPRPSSSPDTSRRGRGRGPSPFSPPSPSSFLRRHPPHNDDTLSLSLIFTHLAMTTTTTILPRSPLVLTHFTITMTTQPTFDATRTAKRRCLHPPSPPVRQRTRTRTLRICLRSYSCMSSRGHAPSDDGPSPSPHLQRAARILVGPTPLELGG